MGDIKESAQKRSKELKEKREELNISIKNALDSKLQSLDLKPDKNMTKVMEGSKSHLDKVFGTQKEEEFAARTIQRSFKSKPLRELYDVSKVSDSKVNAKDSFTEAHRQLQKKQFNTKDDLQPLPLEMCI